MLDINKKYNISNLDDSEMKLLADYLQKTEGSNFKWLSSLNENKKHFFLGFNKEYDSWYFYPHNRNAALEQIFNYRYFYVVTLTQENNNTIFSNFYYTDKKYPSITELKNIALEKFKNIKKVDTIISITEMSKDDYNEFIKE